MSFGGSTAGANVILKNNKRKRKNKLERYEEQTGAKYTAKLSFKKIDQKSLNSFTNNFKKKQQATQKRQLIVFTIATIAVIAIAIYFLYFYEAGCIICYGDR